jgi:hypothetical protein
VAQHTYRFNIGEYGWHVTGEKYGEHPDPDALLNAAPAMLEALKACADWLSRSARIDDQEIAQDARAAIAQAERGDK